MDINSLVATEAPTTGRLSLGWSGSERAEHAGVGNEAPGFGNKTN